MAISTMDASHERCDSLYVFGKVLARVLLFSFVSNEAASDLETRESPPSPVDRQFKSRSADIDPLGR